MHHIEIGAKREEKLLVTSEVAIRFLGEQGAQVLSTPQMIRFMEFNCRNCVLPMLEPGYDTLGTHVDVWHLAAAPLGSCVAFTAEILSVTERRVEYRVRRATTPARLARARTNARSSTWRGLRRR